MPVDFNLYLITDRLQAKSGNLANIIEQALQGGVRAVQLREKDLSAGELFELAVELRRITSRYGARLLINDRADIALAAGADGVHLPGNAIPIDAARSFLGSDRLIGVSCHSLECAVTAQRKGADFITFGPVFFTQSKVAYGEPSGLGKLAQTAAALKIPVFGLGGINNGNARQVMAAGVRGIALISAIIAAEQPQIAAAEILETIHQSL